MLVEHQYISKHLHNISKKEFEFIKNQSQMISGNQKLNLQIPVGLLEFPLILSTLTLRISNHNIQTLFHHHAIAHNSLFF